MRPIRQFHLYVGTLFAPAIIFFALSGVVQVVGLHEARGGAQPAAWIATMARVHKDQTLTAPKHAHDDHDVDHAADKPPKAAAHDKSEAKPAPHYGFKAFVLLMALGMITSAGLGIAIALRNRATRKIALILLAIGTVLPILLLFV